LEPTFRPEGFVQNAIEEHFRNLGFVIDAAGDIDVICRHPTTSERWHIEAKGKTAQPGSTFALALVSSFSGSAMEIPVTGLLFQTFRSTANKFRARAFWAVEALGIHWLLVAPDGSVRTVNPRRTKPRDA
jgi:hypothetical protein